MNNRRICFALLAGLLAFAAPLYPVRAAINDVFCETNWCEVVQAPSGSITYTNVNIWPETNICLGSSIYAYPEANEMCRDVVTRSVWSPASPNCPTTYSTNLSCPYYVTNWYVVSGPGGHTESGGGYGPFGVVITPTNCGSGTLTFYAQWKNTDPCTGQPTGGGTTSKSVSFKVTHVDIAETEKVTCACETTSFSLTNTCGAVTWEIVTNGVPGEPTISSGTVTAGTNCGTWTVVARSVENTNCADYATVTVVRVTGLTGMTGNPVSTNPLTYVVCPVPTNSLNPFLEICASVCPGIEETNLPTCVEMTGGLATTNRLCQQVDLRQQATTTISATAGCSTETVVIIVQDTNPPSLNCPGELYWASDPGYCSALLDLSWFVSASDDCGEVTLTFSPDQLFWDVGEHAITATAVDVAGNTKACTFTLFVDDYESPTIVCPGSVVASNDLGQCHATLVVLGTPTTSDNCGVVGAINNAPSQFPVGTTTVTWTVTDTSGNTATCDQTVQVNDTEKPSISCPPNMQICGGTGGGVATFAPVVSDNCPGVAYACSPASGTTFPMGTTTVTCTATDAAGNTNACTFTVTVIAMGNAVEARRTSAPSENWYPIKDEEHFEVGGTFEFRMVGGTTGNHTKLGWDLWDLDGIDERFATGFGSQSSHVFSAGEPWEGDTYVRFYCDDNLNGQKDWGENYLDSEEFWVQQVKIHQLAVQYSDRLPALTLAQVQAVLNSNAELALRKDSANDWRACIQILATNLAQFVSGPTRPDPAVSQADYQLHFNQPHNLTFLNDTPGIRGVACGIPCSPPKFIVNWNVQRPDTPVHELGHCLGLGHPGHTAQQIMCDGAVRNPTSNELDDTDVDNYDN